MITDLEKLMTDLSDSERNRLRGAFAADPERSPGSQQEAALVTGALDAAIGEWDRAARRLELVVAATLPSRTVTLAVDPVAELAKLWLDRGRLDDALRIGGEAYAISVAGPRYRVEPRIEDIAAMLRSACLAIEPKTENPR